MKTISITDNIKNMRWSHKLTKRTNNQEFSNQSMIFFIDCHYQDLKKAITNFYLKTSNKMYRQYFKNKIKYQKCMFL